MLTLSAPVWCERPHLGYAIRLQVYVAESGCHSQRSGPRMEEGGGPKDAVLRYETGFYSHSIKESKSTAPSSLIILVYTNSISQCGSSNMYGQRASEKREQGKTERIGTLHHHSLVILSVISAHMVHLRIMSFSDVVMTIL